MSGEHPRFAGSYRSIAAPEPPQPPPPPTLDLTAEQQAQIAACFAELRYLSFYDLLGIPRAADKKIVKRAYLQRAAHFHPDRFFRKQLGPFQAKLEAIFARLTQAHDVLCSAELRARYDAELQTNRVSRIDFMLEEAAAEMAGSAEASLREELDMDDLVVVRGGSPKKNG